jgi:hypothetical protein
VKNPIGQVCEVIGDTLLNYGSRKMLVSTAFEPVLKDTIENENEPTSVGFMAVETRQCSLPRYLILRETGLSAIEDVLWLDSSVASISVHMGCSDLCPRENSPVDLKRSGLNHNRVLEVM